MILDLQTAPFDVIVVGAGPAGSMAALHAVRKGARTLLIDRNKTIGTPVRCAEGISEAALINNFGSIKESWVANRVSAGTIISPSGNTVSIKNFGKSIILNRDIFDADIAAMAAEAGARTAFGINVTDLIFEDTNVSGIIAETGSETIRIKARIILFADGIESRLARIAGIDSAIKPADVEVCYQYLVDGYDGPQEMVKFYVGDSIAPGGYLWIFPKGNGKANIGLGIDGKAAAVKKPQVYLDEFMKKNYPDVAILKTIIGSVPVAPQIREPYGNGFMIVGDAARQVNALNGGGLNYGLTAGRIAGTIAARAIKNGDTSKRTLSEYFKLWQKTLGSKKDLTDRFKEELKKIPDAEKDRFAEKMGKKEFANLFTFFSLFFLKKPLLFLNSFRLFFDLRATAAKLPFLAGVAAIFAFMDQVSKILISRHFPENIPYPLFRGEWLDLLRITVVKNYNAIFSTTPQKWVPFVSPTLYFIITNLTASVLVVGIYLSLGVEERLKRFSFALIVGGALGNFIDRLRFGFVWDFIDSDFPDFIMQRWPVFNLADAWVCIGVALFFISSLTEKHGKR